MLHNIILNYVSNKMSILWDKEQIKNEISQAVKGSNLLHSSCRILHSYHTVCESLL